MAKGPDETTDRMFPPPENPNPDPPRPLTPSIREEFLAHRLHIDAQLEAWRTHLGEALARLSPEATVKGALARGAASGGKVTVGILAILAAAEMIVKVWKPQFAGPLGEITGEIRKVLPQ
jgi:hypothetical protein